MSDSPKPERITVTESPTELTLAFRWAGRMETTFTIVLGVILAIVIIRASQPIVWPLVIGATGYWIAGNVFNQTIFRVTHEIITKTYKPVPWPGGRTVSVHEIRSVRCERFGDDDPGYRLRVNMKNGKKIDLISSGDDSDARDIKYIVDRIQEWLGWRYQPDDVDWSEKWARQRLNHS